MLARSSPLGETPRVALWPWLAFAIAAGWSILIRLPLILNAASHLDSDLAVDGLTLLDATRGHWRWHYPGTPFIGSGPVLYSYVQALIWGVTPETLVSGGTLAALGLLLAVFLMAWSSFGQNVAVWSLVPLTFASTGTVWLSGRITGGHLTAALWQAGAFALLARCLKRKCRLDVALLGFWCGLGLALDSMFVVTLGGLALTTAVSWGLSGFYRNGLITAMIFATAFLGGVWPRYVGAWVDPYDAYREQFSPVSDPELLSSHARILALDCLPRLIAGHRLPGLESEPDPASVSAPSLSRRRSGFDSYGALVVGLVFPIGLAAILAIGRAMVVEPSRAVAWALFLTAGATVVGFVVNRNIFNSDNYRYLVGLLIPWSVGFGLAADWLWRRGRNGAIALAVITVILAIVMTGDLARWYARFGWIDERGWPTRRTVDDPILAWLNAHPEVTWIVGGYWDVYRLSFLTGGRVRGAPYPIYPNRFPDWQPPVDADRRATLVRSTSEGMTFRQAALRSGLKPVFQGRGVTILAKP